MSSKQDTFNVQLKKTLSYLKKRKARFYFDDKLDSYDDATYSLSEYACMSLLIYLRAEFISPKVTETQQMLKVATEADKLLEFKTYLKRVRRSTAKFSERQRQRRRRARERDIMSTQVKKKDRDAGFFKGRSRDPKDYDDYL